MFPYCFCLDPPNVLLRSNVNNTEIQSTETLIDLPELDHLPIRKERYEPIAPSSMTHTSSDDIDVSVPVVTSQESLKKPDTEWIPAENTIDVNTSKVSNDDKLFPESSILPQILQNIVCSFKFINSEINKELHPLEVAALRMGIQVLYSDSYNIDVIDVKSPSLIYGKLTSSNYDIELTREVTLAFTKRDELHFTFLAGILCVVFDNNLWKRAVVIKIFDKNVEIFLVDSGKSLKCKKDCIMPMLKEWRSLPAKAFPMKLITVEPKTGFVEWTDEACEFLRKTITKSTSVIKIRPEFKDKMVYGVRMKVGTHSLDKILEDNGMAQRIPCELPQVALQWNQASDTQIHTSVQNYLYEISDIPWEEPATREFEAYVTYVSSPKKFFCRIYGASQDLKVDQIEMELKEHFTSKTNEQSRDVEHGSSCAFKLNKNSWQRGLVLSLSKESAIIFAFDYGFKHTIPLDDVFLLPQAWKQLPGQAIHMQLQYVTPLTQNCYSQYACERFKELTKGRLLLIRVINKNNSIYRVLMYDVKSGCNVGEKLIEEGFAINIFNQRFKPQSSGELFIDFKNCKINSTLQQKHSFINNQF